MNREELLGKYAEGQRDFSNADLRGADLRGANLRGANLSGATLSNATLSNATLSNATLSNATLRGATLSNATLSNATLPVSSHDVIAEILRQYAGESVEKRMIAGCVLVSRDWCWENFSSIIINSQGNASSDSWLWALSVLEEWECFRSHIAEIRSLLSPQKKEVAK